jgi:vitamin B12 transporter
LLRRPKHSGSLGVDYRFCKRFAAHTDATFVGHRLDVGNARNAGYVKWDVALAADVTDHFQVFGRVENLLDDDYEEAKGFPALGITWYVGAKARF